jgi:predicted flap endonuclease-1-like 5' DNA nuclease
MSSYNTAPRYDFFAPYARSADAAGAFVTFWRDAMTTSADLSLWWMRKWLEAPAAFMAWSPLRYMPARSASIVEFRRLAPVIDLAEAAAARAVVEIADVAAEVVEIAETAAETPARAVQDALSVATVAAEAAAPLPPDDLTRLVGIGPKLSIALAERGVTRFAHIAAWTAEDLAEIDRALDLKGRAVRDAWVAQAKRFMAEPPVA